MVIEKESAVAGADGAVDRADLRLGIDVGGTHLRAALVDGRGRVLRSVRQLLTTRDPTALLALIHATRQALGGEALEDLPVGVGLAGQIWTSSGTVAIAPNLGWREVAFGPMLSESFGQPVRLLNDLNAITLGEAVCGAGGGASDVVCIFAGTGVGMGAVMAGAMIEGADGVATELGHTKVTTDASARLCGCGEVGCLEAYVSGRHLPALLGELVAQGRISPLYARSRHDPSLLGADRIDEAASIGDPAAAALWDQVALTLARALGDCITLFNPKILVLGGGVWTSAPSLKERVRTLIGRFAARPAQRHLKIRDAALGDGAGAIGAALAAKWPPPGLT